jgi:DNA-binding response OmpR family regulator
LASGRVIVVHESGGSRALLSELLTREGLRVEALESTFRCIARYVEQPADLVLLGLGGVRASELDLIPVLKREDPPPRVVVTFPSPRRDLAVRALEAGADGYLLEPFYARELTAVVLAQLAPRAPAAATATATAPPDAPAPVSHLAREVAHAINNPLQVIGLLLEKDKVTKRELAAGLPPHLARIREVVRLLKEFGSVAPAQPARGDPGPVVAEVAAARGIPLDDAGAGEALFDPRQLRDAVDALFAAVAGRVEAPAATLRGETNGVVLAVDAPPDAAALLDAVFTVDPDRDVVPGLARARELFRAQGGSLEVHQGRLLARLPRP